MCGHNLMSHSQSVGPLPWTWITATSCSDSLNSIHQLPTVGLGKYTTIHPKFSSTPYTNICVFIFCCISRNTGVTTFVMSWHTPLQSQFTLWNWKHTCPELHIPKDSWLEDALHHPLTILSSLQSSLEEWFSPQMDDCTTQVTRMVVRHHCRKNKSKETIGCYPALKNQRHVRKYQIPILSSIC
jgi:hypothetical protein